MNNEERELFKRSLAILEQWKNCDEWMYPETEIETAKKNTDEIIERITATLKKPQPCKCIDPQRCDTYDRCCKGELDGLQ